MINAICKSCGCEFLSVAIQGLTVCPECGSEDTHAAIYDVDGGVEVGSALNEIKEGT